MNKLLLLLMLYCISSISYANSHKFDFGGYIGYKHIWSSINAAPDESFPEIGMILNYDITPDFTAFTQLNLNKDMINDNISHGISYGFLSYSKSFGNIPFSINIGKLRHDVGLSQIYSLNPSTRNGTTSPQSIYWNTLKSTLISGYGININFELSDFKFGYTIDQHIIVDKKKESIVWSRTPYLKLDPYFGSHQLYTVQYIPMDKNYLIKTGYTIIRLNKNMGTIDFISMGLHYEGDKYELSAESILLKPPGKRWSDVGDIKYGYSVTLGYYIYDDLEIHTNYNEYVSTGNESKNPNISKHVNTWKDLSIGFTKYLGDFEIKADIHKVKGARTLDPKYWQNDNLDSWYYIGSSIVYHF